VALEIDGWRVGQGICKDTTIDEHVADTAALGVDVYLDEFGRDLGIAGATTSLPIQ
jgi:hypothetical protein